MTKRPESSNKKAGKALDFECPICKAPPGTPCDQKGRLHDARRNLADMELQPTDIEETLHTIERVFPGMMEAMADAEAPSDVRISWSPRRVLQPPRGVKSLPATLRQAIERHSAWPWEPLDCGNNRHCLERIALLAYRLGKARGPKRLGGRRFAKFSSEDIVRGMRDGPKEA